jgi:predicted dehydrogenase
LNNFIQQYPDVEICLDVSDVLKRDDIKAVAIATPAETHFELVKEFLHEIEWMDRIPVASKKDYEVVSTDTSEPLKAECSHFLDCLKNRRLPKTDGREGLRVLKILQASQASIDRNGSTINFYLDSSSKPTYRTRRPAASNRFRQDRENRK